MNPADYIRALLSRPVVPEYCAWPAWLGCAFRIDNYSNFTREVQIVHGREGDAYTSKATCKFVAKPIAIVETGVCPVCGKQEVTPFNSEKRRELNAIEAYRQLVRAYSDHAMRYYLIDHWDKLRSVNKGRLHVDHIYPVSRGFKKSVAEIVMGSPVNCQLVTRRRNLRKGTVPGQSLASLLSRYEEFVENCPEWAQLEGVLAKTGTLKGAVKAKTRFRETGDVRAIIGDPVSEDKEVRRLLHRAQKVKPKHSRKRRNLGISMVFEIEFGPGQEKSSPCE